MEKVVKGNLTLIGCGGAGTNLSVHLHKELSNAGDGFANVDVRLIDTTDKTIQNHKEFGNRFVKIVSNRTAGNGLDGSSGERKNAETVKDIIENMKEYMDFAKFKNNKNDYYAIVSSAGGGSGGTISSVLASLMLAKGYNVLIITVGDSSNLLNLTNSFNMLSGLQNIAKKNNRALPVIYYSNSIDNKTTLTTEKEVNDKIAKTMAVVSTFISGDIIGLDNQDMINFFNPRLYKTFTVEAGIYNIGVASGKLTDKNTLLVRTILKNEEDNYDIDVDLQHNKVGVIPDGIADNFKDYPIYLLFRKEILQEQMGRLKDRLDELEHLQHSKYNSIDDLEGSISDEDDMGLVL